MAYASPALLALAADGLRGAHNFAAISIPALLREAKKNKQPPTSLVKFGSTMERSILDSAFALGMPPSPYLSVWSDPPVWLESDIARRGFQAQRTRDAFARDVFVDDSEQTGGRRTQFGLRPTAGSALLAKSPRIRIVDLALWLGHNVSYDDIDDLLGWFKQEFPTDGTDLIGSVYLDEVPDEYRAEGMWLEDPPSDDDILAALDVKTVVRRGNRAQAAASQTEAGLEWTRALVDIPLADANIDGLVGRVIADLHDRNVSLPAEERLVRRCVVALLAGHLVLQGPPGTGKTTLARALARAFKCDLDEVTATSEWSPYDVVGGYRMGRDGLQSHHGSVTRTVIQCAEVVRSSRPDPDDSGVAQQAIPPTAEVQGVWLLVDEFNRADIDKAIGSLYTLLGSSDPDNLASSPIDLWFEEAVNRKRVWVPGRFRIIGAMNDLDTTYVNRISQGLTRRFQFITVGVPDTYPTDAVPVTPEVTTALRQAHRWLSRVYGEVLVVAPIDELVGQLEHELESLSNVVAAFRKPGGAVPGWPVGTAQIVDVLRAVLLEYASGSREGALDRAVADRLVPQMGSIDDDQFDEFTRRLKAAGLPLTAAELQHLIDPHLTQ